LAQHLIRSSNNSNNTSANNVSIYFVNSNTKYNQLCIYLKLTIFVTLFRLLSQKKMKRTVSKILSFSKTKDSFFKLTHCPWSLLLATCLRLFSCKTTQSRVPIASFFELENSLLHSFASFYRYTSDTKCRHVNCTHDYEHFHCNKCDAFTSTNELHKHAKYLNIIFDFIIYYNIDL